MCVKHLAQNLVYLNLKSSKNKIFWNPPPKTNKQNTKNKKHQTVSYLPYLDFSDGTCEDDNRSITNIFRPT